MVMGRLNFSWEEFLKESEGRREWERHIEVKPGRSFGRPTFRGTRLGVFTVLDHMSNGDTEDDLIEQFPTLTKRKIRAALSFAADVMRAIHAGKWKGE